MNPFAPAKDLPRPTAAADRAYDEAAILARSLPIVLDELSRLDPFARLPAPAWNVLTPLLATWGLGERFPTKERVMAAARVSERSARRFLAPGRRRARPASPLRGLTTYTERHFVVIYRVRVDRDGRRVHSSRCGVDTYRHLVHMCRCAIDMYGHFV